MQYETLHISTWLNLRKGYDLQNVHNASVTLSIVLHIQNVHNAAVVLSIVFISNYFS